MKIGICRYVNDGNSWVMSEGIVNTFRRTGHEVWDARLEFNEWPTSEWNALDFLLILEADHYHRPEKWTWLTIPKVLWYTETAQRPDLHFEPRYEEHQRYTPHRFFVAQQDAVRYQGDWMPHGVDLEMYKPMPVDKTTDIGFFGHVYEKRIKFWNQILDAGFEIGRINREGTTREEQFTNLARDINRCRMILALPAYSHSFTTRPLECMACGVPILVPRLADFARCNESQWKHEPCYYDEVDIDSLKLAIERARSEDPAALVAEAARQSTEKKCQRILEVLGK